MHRWLRLNCFVVDFLISFCCVTEVLQAKEKPAYKDSARPVAERVQDLLGRMTVDEKVAQLQGTWQNREQLSPEDDPGRGVSVLQGIRDKLGAGKVVYAEGCRITENKPDWYSDNSTPSDPKLDARRIAEAVKAANGADAAVIVLGENEATSREAWSPKHLGDRDSLDLLGSQDELVRQVLATGTPTIVVLLHGRPNSIDYIAENVPAILDGWYLGQEGGTALANVLFGDCSPGGKLPITVPRSVGQLPDYYYQKPSAKRGYLFANKEPLIPFGYGLSTRRSNTATRVSSQLRLVRARAPRLK